MTTDDRSTLDAPGLPLGAETGLSGSGFIELGEASRERRSESGGFMDFGFIVGELTRRGGGFLVPLVDLISGNLPGEGIVFDAVDTVGCEDGAAALDVDFGPGIDGLVVGVEDLILDLELGVEGVGGAVGLVECNVAQEVGVADLEVLDTVVDVLDATPVDIPLDDAFDVGLDNEVNVDLDLLKVGITPGIEGFDPPEYECLRLSVLEVLNCGEDAGSLDVKLLLAMGSGWGFDS